MKNLKIFSIFFSLFFLCSTAQIKKNGEIPKNVKVGLSLSGGGAKGFAHVGVLKIIDSLGVKIDYVSGTSIGALVGGLYASGYSGKDIEKIMMETDFYTIIANEKNRKETSFFNKSVDKYILSIPIKEGKITLPSSISTGQKNIYILKELFKNVANTNDFSKFPIPFMCVGTNLESGETKIFESGDIVQSVMASSAFPSLMDPVKIGDSLYVDGAMAINYPSKPLKDKGIDVVIGVNLSQGLSKKEEINDIIGILNQIIDFGITKETKNQEKYTDINIHPNLSGMGITSFNQSKSILDSGRVAAMKYVSILDQLPKRKVDRLRIPINPIYSNVYKIDDLEMENNFIFNEDYVKGKMNLKTPSVQTYGSINQMIDKLYATNNYKLISYDIIQKEEKNILKISVNEENTRFFLKFGLHYDEIFKTGLLSNITIKRLLFKNSTVSIDGIIGDKPRYYINYFIDNGYIPSFGAYSSGMSFDLKNNSGNTFENWTWFRNEIFLQSTWRDKYAIGGGLSYDYFSAQSIIDNARNNGHFFNPYAFLRGDTQDDKYFPTKGFNVNVEAKFINVLKTDSDKTVQVKAKLDLSIPINSWLSYRLQAFGGISISTPNYFYQYRLGGIFDQNLGNFFWFSGYQLGQNDGNNLIGVNNSLQFKIGKNYFLSPMVSLADLFENFKETDFLRINYSSVGLTAGYKSPFGQIKINYSHPMQQGTKGIFSAILGHWF